MDEILGTWSLVNYTITFMDEEEVVSPYGKNPLGFLIYTPDVVSVHIMRRDREKKGDLTQEKIETAENYGGYVGKYNIKDSVIIHYPNVCGFIDFLHTPQIRKFSLEGDKLVLECLAFDKKRQKEGNSRLVWQRISL